MRAGAGAGLAGGGFTQAPLRTRLKPSSQQVVCVGLRLEVPQGELHAEQCPIIAARQHHYWWWIAGRAVAAARLNLAASDQGAISDLCSVLYEDFCRRVPSTPSSLRQTTLSPFRATGLTTSTKPSQKTCRDVPTRTHAAPKRWPVPAPARPDRTFLNTN